MKFYTDRIIIIFKEEGDLNEWFKRIIIAREGKVGEYY